MTRTPAAHELTTLTATQAVGLLRRGEVSPLDLVEAAAARIAAVNGDINALPALCLERARDQARALMDGGSLDGDRPGWLAGLPVAIKDYNNLAGVPTTHGSPLFANNIPEQSDHLVVRLENNGAIPIAKSNVPEFAGANTFNRVYGATVNPWDTRLSVAGSSGGAAAALASGMVWLAQGNDLGGSLRTPASFCSIVGLRPSPGRVARGPAPLPFDTLWVEGPLARTVADTALMLDAMAGEHPDDPIALPAPRVSFTDSVRAAKPPKRIAYSRDLGIAPMHPEVAEICAAAAARFAEMGVDVVEDCPDFSGAIETFQTLRAVMFSAWRGPLLADHRAEINPDIVWNIEKGFNITADEVLRAERERAALFHRVAAFFEDYDLLLCPAARVPPFPVGQRYVDEIAGQKLETYIDWISITFAVTLTSCPAISVPCGFTRDDLPVGLQMVGRPHGDAALLGAAHLFEEMTGIAGRVPLDPRVAV